MPRLLVTGSAGLIGSAVCRHFAAEGWEIHGIDNNQRAVFFGPGGDTNGTRKQLETAIVFYEHHSIDIRDREGIGALIKEVAPNAVVHAAAQPSHDLAAKMPFADFDTNAVGTLNLLEGCRTHAPEAPFVFLSTNKVYGDGPNRIALRETATRWEYDDPAYQHGISETFPLDQSLHSLFGVSKTAADLLVQEYGRYFGMPTCCLRGGCLTGANHAGVELHGFLSYLVRCNLEGDTYRVYGYKGKQVRDNINAPDVARLIQCYLRSPIPAAVYNIGGGRDNTCSILEAFEKVAALTGKPMRWEYFDEPRIGDHICYYTDLRKVYRDFPQWRVTSTLDQTLHEIVQEWTRRRSADVATKPSQTTGMNR